MRLAIQGPGVAADSTPRGGRLNLDLRLTGLDAGATYTFAVTLVPVDVLMDGSDGDRIERATTFAGSDGTSDLVLRDIPLGRYRVAATLDGAAVRARVTDSQSRTYGTADVLFDGGFLTCGEELHSNVDITF